MSAEAINTVLYNDSKWELSPYLEIWSTLKYLFYAVLGLHPVLWWWLIMDAVSWQSIIASRTCRRYNIIIMIIIIGGIILCPSMHILLFYKECLALSIGIFSWSFLITTGIRESHLRFLTCIDRKIHPDLKNAIQFLGTYVIGVGGHHGYIKNHIRGYGFWSSGGNDSNS